MQNWINKVIADPVTKLPKKINQFRKLNNYIDARVYLKNTYGWKTWETGQKFYENWLENGEISILKKEPDFKKSKKIEKPIYDESILREFTTFLSFLMLLIVSMRNGEHHRTSVRVIYEKSKKFG